MLSGQCLEVNRSSSIDALEGQHHRLEYDVGHNRKPVELMEVVGHMGEFGKFVKEDVLDTLQRFSCEG